jgi:UDP-N-acetylmuramoyl-tripeptide--D-alanyl-D-alanine ligase
MIPITLEQLADIVGGELADSADASRRVDAVTIDSRDAAPGVLFVPLLGERADGHDFIADAVSRGAAGHLIASDRPLTGDPGAVVVDDPADALLGLGAWIRDTVNPRVVAITGSQGKTSTKDLIAVAASAVGSGKALPVVAAPGSFNNDLGVPLTCCMLSTDSDVLVTEIGTRGLGHIARLVPVARPDIAVVTAVGASHLELLGDIDTVAIAKAELVTDLDPDAVAVLNADDRRVAAMADQTDARVVTYGVQADADWTATDLHFDALARPSFTARGPGDRSVEVQLPLLGAHNVSNALAALAVAHELGVDAAAAAAALTSARVSRWRMELTRTVGGLVVLNDAYNANPASMDAALRTLARFDVPGRRWAVLGQMAELGVTGAASHEAVGRTVAELDIHGLVVVGEAGAGIHRSAVAAGRFGEGDLLLVDDPDEALTVLRKRLGDGDAVLVKASRSVGLERVALALIDEHGGPETSAGGDVS